MIVISLLIFSIYALPLLRYIAINAKDSAAMDENMPTTLVTVLIPYRNESENLKELCNSLFLQNYPVDLLEFIFINDHSTDESASQLQAYCKLSEFSCSLLDLTDTYGKKAALKKGAGNASGDFIITTDADCSMPSNWINTMVYSFAFQKKELVIGPVKLNSGKGLFTHLQEIEFAAIMACTAGSAKLNRAISCNGANLGFSKKLYQQLIPYENNQNIASGDDVFFLFQAKNALTANQIGFVAHKNAVVETNAINKIEKFKNQRIRWAKKSKHFNDWDSKKFGIEMLLVNVLLILQLLYCIFTPHQWWLFAATFLLKFVLDFSLIISCRKWMPIQHSFLKSLGLSIIYPFYLIIFACLSLFANSTWKGRKVAN